MSATPKSAGARSTPGTPGGPYADTLSEILRQDFMREAQEFGLHDLALEDPMAPIIPEPALPQGHDADPQFTTPIRGVKKPGMLFGTPKTPEVSRGEWGASGGGFFAMMGAWDDGVMTPSTVSPYQRRSAEQAAEPCGGTDVFRAFRRHGGDKLASGGPGARSPICLVPVGAAAGRGNPPVGIDPKESAPAGHEWGDVDTPLSQIKGSRSLSRPEAGGGSGRGQVGAIERRKSSRAALSCVALDSGLETPASSGRAGGDFQASGCTKFEFAGSIGCALAERRRDDDPAGAEWHHDLRRSRRGSARLEAQKGLKKDQKGGAGSAINPVPFPVLHTAKGKKKRPCPGSSQTKSIGGVLGVAAHATSLEEPPGLSQEVLVARLDAASGERQGDGEEFKTGDGGGGFDQVGVVGDKEGEGSEGDENGRMPKEIAMEGELHVPKPARGGVGVEEGESGRRKRGGRLAFSRMSKGLKYTSMRVKAAVESQGRTSYGAVADELVQELAERSERRVEGGGANSEGDSLRRRVYDVLNVFDAVGIIKKEDREVQWQGLPVCAEPLEGQLREECAVLRQVTATKQAELGQLMEQYTALTALMGKNGNQPIDTCPQDVRVLPLPFSIVHSPAMGDIDVQISQDSRSVAMAFEAGPVGIHDDMWLLKQMGLHTEAGPNPSEQFRQLPQAPTSHSFSSTLSKTIIDRIKGVFGEAPLPCSGQPTGQTKAWAQLNSDSLDPFVRPPARQVSADENGPPPDVVGSCREPAPGDNLKGPGESLAGLIKTESPVLSDLKMGLNVPSVHSGRGHKRRRDVAEQ